MGDGSAQGTGGQTASAVTPSPPNPDTAATLAASKALAWVHADAATAAEAATSEVTDAVAASEKARPPPPRGAVAEGATLPRQEAREGRDEEHPCEEVLEE